MYYRTLPDIQLRFCIVFDSISDSHHAPQRSRSSLPKQQKVILYFGSSDVGRDLVDLCTMFFSRYANLIVRDLQKILPSASFLQFLLCGCGGLVTRREAKSEIWYDID